ncbi:hypothetical protein [Clostridium fessum]|uniref:hypothetical protein n=1 Tax=Clostridium fessum TaxID=2126740 RepID=UPI0022E1E766|nr:hypothetical protein [Clostridium fessum]
MEWIESQEFQKTLSAKWVNVSGMHFGYVPKNIQNRKCISLYNHRTYSLVYRYQAYKAGHGISPQNFWKKSPEKKSIAPIVNEGEILEESKTASREVMTKK